MNLQYNPTILTFKPEKGFLHFSTVVLLLPGLELASESSGVVILQTAELHPYSYWFGMSGVGPKKQWFILIYDGAVSKLWAICRS